jgi:hypothetical protein
MVIRLTFRLMLVLGLALSGGVRYARATGEYIHEIRFFSRSGMDGGDNLAFFHGRLGILRPTFDDNRLLAAYRQLMGGTFTDAQARALLAPCCDAPGKSDDVQPTWEEVRKRVLSAAPASSHAARERPPEIAALDVSCFPNAYRNAAATLAARIKEHGAGDTWVREWTFGEDVVLANCGIDKDLPPDLPNAPDWLKADRAYQIATAYFYRYDYTRAAELYAAIGRDTASPWRKLARYLSARAAVHAANAEKTEGTVAAAKSAIDALASDPELTDYRDDAPRLASMLAFGTRPEERAQELARSLLAADLPATLAVDLHDFADLERSGKRYTDAGAWLHDINALNGEKGRQNAEVKADVLRRWHDTHTLPWLVATLMFLEPDDADTAEAIAAAQAIDAGSPAYYTLAWNRLRLIIGQGKVGQGKFDQAKADAARADLDRIIATADLPEGVGNLMRYLRLKLARDTVEFASFALRRAEFVMYLYDPRTNLGATPLPLPTTKLDSYAASVLGWRSELTDKETLYIDTDAAYAMSSFMPLPMMAQVVSAPKLPAYVMRDLALSVWTRAVLLDNATIAKAMAGVVAPFFPQFADDWKSYRNATDAGTRKIDAALLLLKLPAARPYPDSGLGYAFKRDRIGLYGSRWWAGEENSSAYTDASGEPQVCDCALPLPLVAPQFITDADKAAAKADTERLMKLPGAPAWLGAIVIPWAKSHLSDPRVPEALHNVVRATQYGDMDTDTSKAAYELLHGKFPRNPWTAKTPYWF